MEAVSLDETEAFAQEVGDIEFSDELIGVLFRSSKAGAQTAGVQQEECCWGGNVRGTTDQCSPGFVVGRGRFKNKFCGACREQGIQIAADRLRTVLPTCQLQNSVATGFWTKGPPSVLYRRINQTGGCQGPPLLVTAAALPPMDGVAAPPDGIVSEQGFVTLQVSKGTLVPVRQWLTSIAPATQTLMAPVDTHGGAGSKRGFAMVHDTSLMVNEKKPYLSPGSSTFKKETVAKMEALVHHSPVQCKVEDGEIGSSGAVSTIPLSELSNSSNSIPSDGSFWSSSSVGGSEPSFEGAEHFPEASCYHGNVWPSSPTSGDASMPMPFGSHILRGAPSLSPTAQAFANLRTSLSSACEVARSALKKPMEHNQRVALESHVEFYEKQLMQLLRWIDAEIEHCEIEKPREQRSEQSREQPQEVQPPERPRAGAMQPPQQALSSDAMRSWSRNARLPHPTQIALPMMPSPNLHNVCFSEAEAASPGHIPMALPTALPTGVNTSLPSMAMPTVVSTAPMGTAMPTALPIAVGTSLPHRHQPHFFMPTAMGSPPPVPMPMPVAQMPVTQMPVGHAHAMMLAPTQQSWGTTYLSVPPSPPTTPMRGLLSDSKSDTVSKSNTVLDSVLDTVLEASQEKATGQGQWQTFAGCRVPIGVAMLALAVAQAHLAWSTRRSAPLLTAFICVFVFSLHAFASCSDEGLLATKELSQKWFNILFRTMYAILPIFFLIEDGSATSEMVRINVEHSMANDIPQMVFANVALGALHAVVPGMKLEMKKLVMFSYIFLMEVRIAFVAFKAPSVRLDCLLVSSLPLLNLVGFALGLRSTCPGLKTTSSTCAWGRSKDNIRRSQVPQPF